MPGGVLIARRHAHRRINRRHAARDVRHATDHDGHEFAARHARNIGPDDQRRLGLAHENVRGGGERFTAAGAKRLAHHPGDRAHDALQNAPVIEKRGQRGHDDDRAGDEDGEDQTVLRPETFAEQIPVRQRSENKLGSVRGKLDEFLDDLARELKHLCTPRRLQDQQREDKLQADAPDDRAPRKFFAVEGDRPGDGDHRDPAKKTDEFEFHYFSPARPLVSL